MFEDLGQGYRLKNFSNEIVLHTTSFDIFSTMVPITSVCLLSLFVPLSIRTTQMFDTASLSLNLCYLHFFSLTVRNLADWHEESVCSESGSRPIQFDLSFYIGIGSRRGLPAALRLKSHREEGKNIWKLNSTRSRVGGGSYRRESVGARKVCVSWIWLRLRWNKDEGNYRDTDIFPEDEWQVVCATRWAEANGIALSRQWWPCCHAFLNSGLPVDPLWTSEPRRPFYPQRKFRWAKEAPSSIFCAPQIIWCFSHIDTSGDVYFQEHTAVLHTHTHTHTQTDLHLLVSVLGGVFAALALPAQFLQLRLALLQTLPFALVLHLVLFQCGLGRGQYKVSGGAAALACPRMICTLISNCPDKCLVTVLTSDWCSVMTKTLMEGLWCVGYLSFYFQQLFPLLSSFYPLYLQQSSSYLLAQAFFGR